jgi:biopolymer transport protein TolQ
MGIALFHSAGAPVLGSAFVYAIQESHLPGQIVCAILLLLSTLSWAVMITKFVTVARARRHTFRFLETFRSSRAPLDIYSDSIRFENAPIYWVYRAGCKELSYQLTGSTDVNEEFLTKIEQGRKIAPSQVESATNAMDRAVGEVGIRLENQMTFLATAVSGAPFLGLLGTVWGVMETFSGIASSSAATSLQDMSPGVSAALVTTVIALLVAIPAMFGYNFLINNIKTLLAEMDNFVAELTSAFERRYRDASPVPASSITTGSVTGAALATSAAAKSTGTGEPSSADLSEEPTHTASATPEDIVPDDKLLESAGPPPGYYSPPSGDAKSAAKSTPESAPTSEISPALEELEDLNALRPPSSYRDPEPEPQPEESSPPELEPEDLPSPEESLDLDTPPEQKPELELEPSPVTDDDFITGLRSKPGESPLEDLLFADDDEDETPATNQSSGSS